MTFRHLAKKLDVPYVSLTHFAGGIQKKPAMELILKLITIEGVDPLWLAGDIGDDNVILYSPTHVNRLQQIYQTADMVAEPAPKLNDSQ